LDSQRFGPLDHRLPVFGVRRDGSFGSLARDYNPIFSHILVAIARKGKSAIAGAICCSGNMDIRSLNDDIQFKFLWRRAFSAGCLAVFYLRYTIVSAIYVSDVRLRWHVLRSVAYDIAASHPRELTLQGSRAPTSVIDLLRFSQICCFSRMTAFSDCGSHIPKAPLQDLAKSSTEDVTWHHCSVAPNAQRLSAARPKVRGTWPPRCPPRTCTRRGR
jgi:hypothetical protein